ncbi:hypothetical protein DFJ73DRAFT_835852 [Zopfochytrium polystomum]|nr:hypothetical protein DFJ73DRAFT_835852 [Zopfochytrium polystomum]
MDSNRRRIRGAPVRDFLWAPPPNTLMGTPPPRPGRSDRSTFEIRPSSEVTSSAETPIPNYLMELCDRSVVGSSCNGPTVRGHDGGVTPPTGPATSSPLSCSLPETAFMRSGFAVIEAGASIAAVGASPQAEEGDTPMAEQNLESIPTTDVTSHSTSGPPSQGLVVEDWQGRQMVFPTMFFKDLYGQNHNHNMLNLSDNDRRVKYIGPGNGDEDAAAIRANFPIPTGCGIYYFEVTVMNKGRDGWMGVGVCEKTVPLNRLPGWDNLSWGYHGDDGYSFESSGKGKPYGPTFSTGDTIGCLVNFRRRTVSFTKNGIEIGIAFRNMKMQNELYPVIGMRTPNEELVANFGSCPFKFDIDSFVKDEKRHVWNDILATPLVPPPTFSDPPPLFAPAVIQRAGRVSQQSRTINGLILSYLRHNGYRQTADLFSTSAVSTDIPDGVSELGTANGMEVDKAVSPDSKSDQWSVRAEIRNSILAGDIPSAVTLLNTNFPGILSSKRNILFALKCRQFIELIAARTTTSSTKGKQPLPSFPNGYSDDEAVGLGRELMSEFRSDANASPAVQAALAETFSLLAYADPLCDSPNAHLLSPNMREPYATLVDRAVLEEIGALPDSALERVIRQVLLLEELLKEHSPGGAFVHVERDILRG